MDPPPAPSAEGSSVRPAEGNAAPHHADSGPQQPPLQNGTAHEPDLRELPVVLQDLVPLSYLIDRVVAAAYSDLATLVETLPGSLHGPDASHDHLQQQQRKRSIVDHVLATRRQLVKLLVLARWGAEAHRVHTAVNLVGFLAIQNVQVDRAIEHLRESHDLLARARVRTYDLDTAVKVLSLDAAADASQDLRIDPHAYSSLPAALTDHFAPDAAAPLSDDQALTTLSELNRVLLARLVLRLEPLPAPLADPTHWNVHDGRVTFRVDGMWEADLTYGGGNSAEDEAEEGREWYLLAVRFLFRVKDNRGAWSSTPLGAIKDHLLDLCNRELLRRPFFPAPLSPRPNFTAPQDDAPAASAPAGDANPAGAPKPDSAESLPNGTASAQLPAEEGKAAHSQQEIEWEEKERKYAREREQVRRKRRRDRPLERGYTFLQRLALSYQLEAIHAAAARLASTSWNGSLEVERRQAAGNADEKDIEGEDEVRLHYWRPPPSLKPSLPHSASGKAPRPNLASQKPGGRAGTPSNQPPAASSSAPPGRRSGPGGTLVFSLRPVKSALGSSERAAAGPVARGREVPQAAPRARARARSEALQAALDAAVTRGGAIDAEENVEEAVAEEGIAPAVAASVPAALSVTWLASSSSPSSSESAALSSLDLTALLGDDLDVERVLRHLTAVHARETMERLAGLVVGASEATKRATLVTPGAAQQPGAGQQAQKEEEEARAYPAVPYLHVPLVGAHAVAAQIDPVSGCFELRATMTSPTAGAVAGADAAEVSPGEEEGSSSGGRDQRLRLAAERIDRERFAPSQLGAGQGARSAGVMGQQQLPQGAEADAWMKGVLEVLARIRASTIIDELDTLLSLLSLPLASPPTRRLPLPPRELAKLGPNPSAGAGRAAFLFVPLLAGEPALAGWFLVFELFEEGLRAALMSTAERSDQIGHWTEILEVGWLGGAGGLTTAAAVGGGERSEAPAKGRNLGFEVKSETIRALWWFCVRHASAFTLEQQLHARRIPYRREATSATTAARLALTSTSLLRLPDLAQVLRPEAELRCAVEEDGRRRSILLVYLRLAPGQPSPLPPPNDLPPSILYNPAKGALVLLTEGGLGNTVERLLRALATVVKLVQASQPAGSPVKTPHRALKLERN